MKMNALAVSLVTTLVCACSGTDFQGVAGRSKAEDSQGKSQPAGDHDEDLAGDDGESGNDGGSDTAGTDGIDASGGDTGGGGGDTGIGDSDDDGIDASELSEAEAFAKCGEGVGKTYTTTLKFPSNRGDQCAWSSDGNLSAGGAADIRARRRFSKAIKLPTDKPKVFLCSLSISTENRFTVFDDDIVVTLNDWIIASDYLNKPFYEARQLTRHNALFKYDFAKIAGAKWPTEAVYMGPGVTGDINTRQNAASKREGSLAFAMSDAFVRALPAAEIRKPSYDFNFYIHGNRTIDQDCQHDGFDFKVEARFLD